MALDGRRGVRQAFQLQYLATVGHVGDDVIAHQSAHLLVVARNESCVVVAIDASVGYDDGYARVVSLRHDVREGIGNIGRHDEQIDTLADEFLDVGALTCIVILRVAKLQGDVGVEKLFASHFLVHLLSPSVIARLRNADDIPLLCLHRARRKERKRCYCQY